MEPVKVVIINTQYVETDAVSFKSVVQKLTGKDSSTAVGAAMMAKEPPMHRSGKEVSAYNNNPARVLGRGLSVNDFDRMLKELPSLDELYRHYPE